MSYELRGQDTIALTNEQDYAVYVEYRWGPFLRLMWERDSQLILDRALINVSKSTGSPTPPTLTSPSSEISPLQYFEGEEYAHSASVNPAGAKEQSKQF